MAASIPNSRVNDNWRSSLNVTDIDVLERRVVSIPAKNWKAFEAWAHRPGKKIAALSKLALTQPKWK